jgi:hypothetical protein
MKAASSKELKAELATLHPQKLIELCMHLAKFKKENKELLTYLLFDSDNEESYIKDVKDQIDEQFEGLNKINVYLAKKTIRKVLRTTNKFIKYSGIKQTEVDLLIYFCKKIRKTGIPLYANTALGNLYLRQISRIRKAISTLHEDLQFDHNDELKLIL